MITTSVLAKKADVSIFTVRHYSRIGLLTPSYRKNNGYKIYKESDISLLRFISSAKVLRFTLKEIAQIIEKADDGKSPCPIVREIVVKRIKENPKKIQRLQILQKKMTDANNQWAKMKDAVPDGDSVCRLIESFAE